MTIDPFLEAMTLSNLNGHGEDKASKPGTKSASCWFPPYCVSNIPLKTMQEPQDVFARADLSLEEQRARWRQLQTTEL